ncbi:vasodilator-stimulated phosphoprotein-like [Panicum virgatum]|uniref:vasodilator-stimulated phosphoprotein-like n=1 Tax=Panicum virgatum TaxID=38727 RepID=UPI0019D56C22|nr:vasodilator-stimulated phosphoprotein-like [Panicum virgatum]
MASVDTHAGAPPPPPVPWPWPWPWPDPVPAAGGGAGAEAPTVADVEVGPGGEANEEWLARLLACGGPLLEGVLLL